MFFCWLSIGCYSYFQGQCSVKNTALLPGFITMLVVSEGREQRQQACRAFFALLGVPFFNFTISLAALVSYDQARNVQRNLPFSTSLVINNALILHFLPGLKTQTGESVTPPQTPSTPASAAPESPVQGLPSGCLFALLGVPSPRLCLLTKRETYSEIILYVHISGLRMHSFHFSCLVERHKQGEMMSRKDTKSAKNNLRLAFFAALREFLIPLIPPCLVFHSRACVF